jgi:hypothetical protein
MGDKREGEGSLEGVTKVRGGDGWKTEKPGVYVEMGGRVQEKDRRGGE